MLLKYFFYEVLNSFLLKCKKNKTWKFDEKKFKGQNIGCRFDNPEDYLGIDGGVYIIYRTLPKFIFRRYFNKANSSRNYTFEEFYNKVININVIHYDLGNKVPFFDNSIPYIFSSHFFEHFIYDDAKKYL